MRAVFVVILLMGMVISPALWGNAAAYQNDSTRVHSLNHRAQNLMVNDPAKAINLATEAKDLAEQLAYQNGITESLKILGRSYKIQKEYLTALEHYLIAAKDLEKQGNIPSLAEVQTEIGLLFVDWGVHKKATEYFSMAYERKESMGDIQGQIELLTLLGDTYYQSNNRQKAKQYYQLLLNLHLERNQKKELLTVLERLSELHQSSDSEKALEYELQSLKIKKEMEDYQGMVDSYKKIGNFYKNMNDNDQALTYYKKSLALNQELLGKVEGEQNDDILMDIAFIHQAKGEYDEALKYLFSALDIRRSREDFVRSALVNREISFTYQALGKLKPAREYAEMAVRWSEQEKAYEVLRDSYKLLSDIYLSGNDDEKALKYYKKYSEITNQLLVNQNNQKQQLLEQQLEIERKEKDFRLLQVEKEIKNLEVKELQYIADKKEADIELLKKERELQETSLKHQQAEKEKAQQALQLSQQAYEAEMNRTKMGQQAMRLKNKELEELERQKTIALLEERKALQESELKISQAMRTFFFGLSVLFAIILFLIYRSYRLKQKANTRLALQNMEIQQQKDRLEKTLKELKLAHTQIVQSEKMASLGELTAGIAHEINNPINFVYAGVDGLRSSLEGLLDVLDKYAQLDDADSIAEIKTVLDDVKDLKQQLYFDETQDNVFEVVNAIKEGATRTAEIVKGLRSFSRLDETELKQADIHDGMDNTLVLLNSKIERDRITVIKDYDSSVPEIECFPGQLNQVFMNILGNAIDSIIDKGTVTIETKNFESEVQVKIKDTGKGMSEEVKAKIFQPFFTTKGLGEGTGLGLSITFGIIDKHGGKITVDSAPGKGTTCTILIPKKHQQEPVPVLS
jgi:signal transduction histidine kinase/tetratricopeptide (TPR) repeat protein